MPATVKLEGIGLGAKKGFAVINDQVYYEGESKDGIQVTQIRKREVDIVMSGLSKTLHSDVFEQKTNPKVIQQAKKFTPPFPVDKNKNEVDRTNAG